MKTKHLIAISTLLFIAVCVRSIPLSFSSLPYNIDSFPLVKISEEMIATGHWVIDSQTPHLINYNSKMPVFSLILSTFALIFGKAPMEIVQIILPIIASTSVIIIYMITFKITKNYLASFAAGLFLALNGFFVYLTTAIMKEGAALILLPIILLLYSERDDFKKRILCSLLLLLIPLVHHLTAIVAFIMITLLAISSNFIALKSNNLKIKKVALDVLLGPMLFLFTYAYYKNVKLAYFEITTVNDIVLFLSVFFIGSLSCILLCKPASSKPWFFIRSKHMGWKFLDEKILIAIGAILLLILNNRMMVFGGTIRTSSLFLYSAVPYIILALIGVVGFNMIRHARTSFRPFIISMILGPLILIVFAFLRGLDAFTFTLAYRSYNYVEFGLAICVGISFGLIIGHILKVKGRSGVVITMIFAVICLCTTPLAYNSEALYGVQDTTYDYEYKTMEWLSDTNVSQIGTDQRLSDIINPYFNIGCDRTLPWKIKYGRDLKNSDFLLLKEAWVTTGAQMFPCERVKISEENFNNILKNNDVVYASGSTGEQIYVIKVNK